MVRAILKRALRAEHEKGERIVDSFGKSMAQPRARPPFNGLRFRRVSMALFERCSLPASFLPFFEIALS